MIVRGVKLSHDASVAVFDNWRPFARVEIEMLFAHEVRSEAASGIPDILHFDGSGRLQTVVRTDGAYIYALLTEPRKISSLPILCRPRANFDGRSFFPEVEKAIKWRRARRILSERIFPALGGSDRCPR